MQCYAILCSVLQCNAMLCYAILYRVVQCNAVQYSVVQCYAVISRDSMCYSVLPKHGVDLEIPVHFSSHISTTYHNNVRTEHTMRSHIIHSSITDSDSFSICSIQ